MKLEVAQYNWLRLPLELEAMSVAIPGRKKTFNLENCRDVRDKLEWEIDGLRNAFSHDLDSLRFGACNAVQTAWHIVEWVWKDMTDDQREALKDEWSLPRKALSSFKRRARTECRAVGICREIAIASKHVEVTQSPDPTVDAIVTAARVDEEEYSSDNFQISWKLLVKDKGEKRDVIEVLEQAFDFWTSFIYQRGVAK